MRTGADIPVDIPVRQTVRSATTGGQGCPMSLGLWNLGRANVFVPEGHVKIAQRFSVGLGIGRDTSPEGTVEDFAHFAQFSRPFGTDSGWTPDPNAEALGYFSELTGMKSLEIRVALGGHWHIGEMGEMGENKG